MTIGPEAKAGSTPNFTKKNGERTPKVVAVNDAPKTPAATVTPSCNPPPEKRFIPMNPIRYTTIPQRIPKATPVNKPILISLNMVSLRLPNESVPVAILRTKIVLHCTPTFPDIPLIKGIKKMTNASKDGAIF
ncbi:Uncharacterised protein [Chlamydia abortus]|nr:Uncharacterised protein [Chlamydia abortus]